MNIDAGTMAPTEHGESFCVLIHQHNCVSNVDIWFAGEVYVLNDGGEVDLDLGNYERYLNVTLNRDNNITTGKVYREVIDKEVCAAAKTPYAYMPLNFILSAVEARRLSGQDSPGP